MNTIDLTDEYFSSFLEYEGYFRIKYGDAYYSKPVIYDKDNSILTVAPWGEPGYPTTIILPYAHYVCITAIKKKNVFAKPKPMVWVYKMEDLIDSLNKEYEVIEFKNDPISYIEIQIPEFIDDKKEYNRFWNLLYDTPTAQT